MVTDMPQVVAHPTLNGLRLQLPDGTVRRIDLSGIDIAQRDVVAINEHIRGQGITDVTVSIAEDERSLRFNIEQGIASVRIEALAPAVMVTMCPYGGNIPWMNITVSSTTYGGSGVPSMVRGIAYPSSEIQGAAELNTFLRSNDITWLEAVNDNGLLGILYEDAVYIPRVNNSGQSESVFRATYGIPPFVCEYSVLVDHNRNTHVSYKYPRGSSSQESPLDWYPGNASDGDTINIQYPLGFGWGTLRRDRVSGRWQLLDSTPSTIAWQDDTEAPTTSRLGEYRVRYDISELSNVVDSELLKGYVSILTPKVKHYRPNYVTLNEACRRAKLGSFEKMEAFLDEVLALDSEIKGYRAKKGYPTYDKSIPFQNQTHLVGSIPDRLSSVDDIVKVIDSYHTMTPSVFRQIRKKTGLELPVNALFSHPKARKYPMHPIVSEDGIQFKVIEEDWNFFFFKGGAVPNDVNLKFIAFPIFDKEECFLHEMSKRHRFDKCQEHELLAYRKASGVDKITVQGHVFDEDLITRARFWTIKSNYLKLFISDKFRGRKYICNVYFELSDTIESEIITVKHLSSDYTFATSGRVMDASEVFEKLSPNPQSRPFIRSSIDPEYQEYIKTCFSFKRPRFVFKAKGRKLGNLKGVCQ